MWPRGDHTASTMNYAKYEPYRGVKQHIDSMYDVPTYVLDYVVRSCSMMVAGEVLRLIGFPKIAPNGGQQCCNNSACIGSMRLANL
jgi:hypothetical protein